MGDLEQKLRRRLRNRSLNEVFRALSKEQRSSKLFSCPEGDNVFSKLRQISRLEPPAIEAALIAESEPPRLGEKVDVERFIWCHASFYIFLLNPILSDDFCRKVSGQCLSHPTDMVLALHHSEAVAFLARDHPNAIDPNLVEIVIDSTNDSRALYALRIARWIGDWADVRTAVFRAMLADTQPKRIEALWTARERGTFAEVMEFAQSYGIEIPPSVIATQNLTALTKTVADSSPTPPSNGIAYALKLNGAPISQSEMDDLSARIKSLLEKDANAEATPQPQGSSRAARLFRIARTFFRLR